MVQTHPSIMPLNGVIVAWQDLALQEQAHSPIGNPAALLSAPKAGAERGTCQRLMQL